MLYTDFSIPIAQVLKRCVPLMIRRARVLERGRARARHERAFARMYAEQAFLAAEEAAFERKDELLPKED